MEEPCNEKELNIILLSNLLITLATLDDYVNCDNVMEKTDNKRLMTRIHTCCEKISSFSQIKHRKMDVCDNTVILSVLNEILNEKTTLMSSAA